MVLNERERERESTMKAYRKEIFNFVTERQRQRLQRNLCFFVIRQVVGRIVNPNSEVSKIRVKKWKEYKWKAYGRKVTKKDKETIPNEKDFFF